MNRFEYKVVPAPKKGVRGKGVKGTPGKFARALEIVMNELGAEGWEYLRTDTLPSEERAGLTGRITVFQNMLVFRRALADEAADETAADETSMVPESATAPTAPALPGATPANEVPELPDNVASLSPARKPDLTAAE